MSRRASWPQWEGGGREGAGPERAQLGKGSGHFGGHAGGSEPVGLGATGPGGSPGQDSLGRAVISV